MSDRRITVNAVLLFSIPAIVLVAIAVILQPAAGVAVAAIVAGGGLRWWTRHKLARRKAH